MCLSGEYTERGIWKQHGYQTELVTDREEFAVKVPPKIEDLAVLTEPLSVAEKAIDECARAQLSRVSYASDWPGAARCLIAGLGPVGMLAAMVLRLRGARVWGLDIVDRDCARARWFAGIGGEYIDGREVPADHIDESIGAMDFVLEAAGAPRLQFDLIDALGTNGVYAVTGIPAGNRSLHIPGAELIRQMVLENQMMLGSVNASVVHYERAVDDLVTAKERWGDHMSRLITNRHPFSDYKSALEDHGQDEIKVVLEW